MPVLLSIDEYFAVHIPFQQTLEKPQLSQSGSIDRAISVFFSSTYISLFSTICTAFVHAFR